MRVCEPLEGISSWSGWFLVAILKLMRSTSEANIRNLENVFSNIRAFAAITGGAVKFGASCTRRVRAVRIDRLERV